MGYIIISLLLELFFIIATGQAVNMGYYGTAASFALCAVVIAIYEVAYIMVWHFRKHK